MPKEMDSAPIPVSVCIKEWIEGRHGKYALAKVLTPEAPSAEAMYSLKLLKVQPDLDVPFDCMIELSKGRWRVVELAQSAKPVETELTGFVESSSASSGRRSWRVKVISDRPVALYATLDSTTLRKARFAHIELGQVLTFMALPGDAAASADGQVDWTVTKILEPTLDTVITDPLVSYHGFSIGNWSPDDARESASFAVRLPGVSIWPLVNVFKTFLRRQSIPSLVAVDLTEPGALSRAQDYIVHAQEVLREGEPEEIDLLTIGCLEFTLAWNARGFWNTLKLVAPTPMREPKANEVVDWVEGTVIAVVQQESREPVDAADVEPAEDSGIDLQDEVSERELPIHEDSSTDENMPRKIKPKVKVAVEIKDRRIGRGQVNGFLKSEMAVHGGLINGTKVVVQLVGNPPYWNIRCLHRSTPVRGDV